MSAVTNRRALARAALGILAGALVAATSSALAADAYPELRPSSVASAVSVYLCAVVLLCCIATRVEPADRPLVIGLFVVRLTLLAGLSGIYFGGDEATLHAISAALSDGHSSWVERVLSGDGYAVLIAAMYRLFGPDVVAARIVNCVVGVAAAVLAGRLAMHLFDDRVIARRAVAAVGLAPPLLIYSALNLKEIATVGILLLLLVVLLNPKSGTTQRLALAAVVAILMYVFRGEWLLFCVAAIAAAILLQVLAQLRGAGTRWASAGLLGLAGILFVYAPQLVADAGRQAQERVAIGTDLGRGSFNASTGSATRSLLDSERPFAPRNLILQGSRVPFVPAPVAAVLSLSPQALIDSAVGVTNVIVTPLAALGLWRRRSQRVAVVALVAILILGVVALSLNLGLTLGRQIVPAFAPLLVLASGGWDFRQRARTIFAGWGAIAVSFNLAYWLTH